MKQQFKLLQIFVFCTVFIIFLPSITQARIILVGDSILDNAYWDTVRDHPTGQCLVEEFNLIYGQPLINGEPELIDDRSTEEATTDSILNALNGDGLIGIPDHAAKVYDSYEQRRKRNNVAYNSTDPSSARLSRYCIITESIPTDSDDDENGAAGYTAVQIDTPPPRVQVNIKSDIEGSYVFISVGGNDLLLNYSNPFRVLANLKKIATNYRKLGAKKVIYIFPYKMTKAAGLCPYWTVNTIRACAQLTLNLSGYFDHIIDLSDFDDSLRTANCAIPEPTALGAREIARRIDPCQL